MKICPQELRLIMTTSFFYYDYFVWLSRDIVVIQVAARGHYLVHLWWERYKEAAKYKFEPDHT